MRIIDFIVCDDIRQEVRNKVTLIGIYGDTINLETSPGNEIKWPIALKLGIFVRVKLDQGDDLEKDGFTFQLSMVHAEQKIIEVNGNFGFMKVEPTSVVGIPIVYPPVPLNGPGKLVFSFRVTKGEQIILEEDTAFEMTLRVRELSAVIPALRH